MALRTKLIAAAVGALAFAGAGPALAQDDTIRIGALAQMSGGASFLGPSESAAYRMAVTEINAAGGLLGKEVELILVDSATDPAVANTGAKRLINRDGVAAIFASTTSASREAILSVVRANGETLFFYNAIYEGHACDDSMFVMGEVPENQINPIVPYLQEKTGGSKWYFVGNDYNWPQNTATIAEQAIPDAGGELVGTKFVPIGTADFSAILQDIAATDPDYVLLIMLPGDVVAFMKQFRNQGLHESVIPVATLVEQSAIAAMGPASQGLMIPAGYFAGTTEEAIAFETRYKEVLGTNAAAQNFISMNAYDAVHLWARAVAKAGTTEKDAVAAAVPTVSFDGPRGNVHYSAATRHATFPIYLAEIGADGNPAIEKNFGPVDPGEQCSF